MARRALRVEGSRVLQSSYHIMVRTFVDCSKGILKIA